MQTETQNALDVFKAEFEKRVTSWQAIFESGQVGTEYAALSLAECEVFELDPDRWSRLCALWEAYEDVKGICDMGGYNEALYNAVAAEIGFPPSGDDLARISLEELQALGQAVAVTYRESYALFFKIQFYERRAGLTRYKDEQNDAIPF